MTEELRTLLRSELNEERPPPLGDLVGVAMRDGRRIRRVRRLGLAGAGAAVLSVVAVTAALAGPFGSAAAPHRPADGVQVAAPVPAPPTVPSAAAVLGSAHPFPVTIDGRRAAGPQKRATAGAMLLLLTKLLPPGKTSHYAVIADRDTHVQLYLDTGQGPGMIRASLERDATDPPLPKDAASVSIEYLPDNCVQSIVVDAALPGGVNVAIDIANCLAWDGRTNRPAPQPISAKEAVQIATDPRWGMTMDAELVDTGDKLFPDLPTMR